MDSCGLLCLRVAPPCGSSAFFVRLRAEVSCFILEVSEPLTTSVALIELQSK